MHLTPRSRAKYLPCVAVVALALLAAASAEAVTELNTTILRSGGSVSVEYRCQLTNVGTKPIENTTIAVLSGTTTVASSFTYPTIAAGSTAQITVFGDDAFSARCRVTGKFSKRKVVVSFQLFSDSTGITQVVVPAQ